MGEKTKAVSNSDFNNYIKLQFIIRKTNELLTHLFVKQWNSISNKESNWENSTSRNEFLSGPGKKLLENAQRIEKEFLCSRNITEWDMSLLIQAMKCLYVDVPANIFEELESLQKKIKDHKCKIEDEDFDKYCNQINILLSKLNLPREEIDEIKSIEIMPESMEQIPFQPEVQKLKSSGNEAFAKENFKKAVQCYTQAISLPDIPVQEVAVLYSNRSFAFLKLGRTSHAKEDAAASIYLSPTWWKGYYRLAMADTADEDHESALQNLLLCQCFHEKPSNLDDEIKLCKRSMDLLKRGKKKDPMHPDYNNYSAQSSIAFYYYAQAMTTFKAARTKQQYEESVEWFHKAAAEGNADAMFYLGTIYLEGDGGIDPSPSKAIKLLKEAAEQPSLVRLKGELVPAVGVASAQFTLGTVYEEGVKAVKSYEKARYWFERAIKNWYGEAAYCVGRMHAKAMGVPKSQDLAIQYWKLGAGMGYGECMVRLVHTYFDLGDYDKMQRWYLYGVEFKSQLKSVEKFKKHFKETVTRSFKRKEFSKSLWHEIENGPLKHLVDKKMKKYYENDRAFREAVCPRS